MVYKQKVLGAINASGAEKNYKFMYIKKLLDRIDKINDALPGENSATKIITWRNQAINYVDKKIVKTDMMKRADALATNLERQMQEENGGMADNSHHIEANRVAASVAIGWVLDYFDTAWGWSTRRGILIAGPFGDGRRRFRPLTDLPEDGNYLKLPDEYESKISVVTNEHKELLPGKYLRLPDDYDVANKENNIIVPFDLREVLTNNIDEKNPYEEARTEKEEPVEEQQPQQPAGETNGNDNSASDGPKDSS